MPRTQQIKKNGTDIFHMDFSFLKDKQEIRSVILEGAKFIRSKPAGSVLTLTNIEGMHFNNEVKELFKDFLSGNKAYVKAGAIVGLNGLQQILYNGLMKVSGRDIKSFTNIESAAEWLINRN